jgi:hypothetical protein
MRKLLLVPIGLSLVVAGCGSSSSHKAAAPATKIVIPRVHTSGAAYHPKIDPKNFSTNITNKYWPMKPGSTWDLAGTKDGVPETVHVVVKKGTKKIMGVDTVVIQDTVTINHALEENTTDWYAQDKQGNLWYFGEDSKDYKNGIVISTQGTWEAGVDGAQPGIVVKAHPAADGKTYRQEFRPGVAEDQAKVLATNATEKVPAGVFKSVLHTFDTDPLNPDKVENKWYAPGVGPVHTKRIGSAHTEETRLVKYTHK